MNYKLLLLTLLLIACFKIYAQPPFYSEIRAFKKQDSTNFPAPGQILFVGSSSFNYWKDVQTYFPAHPIINRGFGGSTLLDVIRYANDIIIPYKPAQVVIYCGENDLAYSNKVTPDSVLQRFKQLFSIIRDNLPNASIVFVSIKPSPSRQKLMPEMIESNKLIKDFLLSQKNSAFVDVYSKMLDNEGNPIKEIFKEDNLHMNPKGYAIWQKAIEPYLKVNK